eukprot:516834-Pyramimonas_sp.AAC.1
MTSCCSLISVHGRPLIPGATRRPARNPMLITRYAAASCKPSAMVNLGVRVNRSRAISLRCRSGPTEGTTMKEVCGMERYELGTYEIEARDGDESVKGTFEVPIGSTLITVALAKPLGLQLEERNGEIVVDDIIYGSNAEKSGAVQKGDILRGVTARVRDGAAPRSELLRNCNVGLSLWAKLS